MYNKPLVIEMEFLAYFVSWERKRVQMLKTWNKNKKIAEDTQQVRQLLWREKQS